MDKRPELRPILGRLRALCIYSDDPKFLGNLLVFIARPQSLAEFTNWASECRHAKALADLHIALQSGYAQEFQANDAKRLQDLVKWGDSSTQYPAALLIARYPVTGEPAFDQWLHRLRVYLLTRMLDALEASVPRDAYLRDVAYPLRRVCDQSIDFRAAWFKELVTEATGFDHFEAITRMQCRLAASKFSASPSAVPDAEMDKKSVRLQLEFYRKLAHIMEGINNWHPFAVPTAAGTSAPINLSDYGFVDRSPESINWNFLNAEDPTDGVVEQPAPGFSSTERKPKEPAFRAQQRGEKVRLRHTVDNLALAASWYNLLPDEEDALLAKVDEWLESNDQVFQLAGAIASVALSNSATLWEVQGLALHSEPTQDRWLDLESGQIVRKAPRPTKHWKIPDPDSPPSLLQSPILNEWRHSLDARVLRNLRAAQTDTAVTATQLEDLWKAHATQDLMIWFDAEMAKDPRLARLSHPCTAHVVQVHAFRKTQDYSCAQLLSADQRTPLPASASYGAYTPAEVHSALDTVAGLHLASLVTPTAGAQGNAAGSNIDLLVQFMAIQVKRYRDELLTLNPATAPVLFHNKLTGYLVLCLLASTGGRPVDSPFEKLSWFDPERALVFIADKRAGPTLGARLCVLSSVSTSVLKLYLQHLLALAAAMEPADPQFCGKLKGLASGAADPGLPLLFFLSEEPTPCWLEVSETTLNQYVGINDGLPWNLLRHCFSTQVRRMGLHADIRDGLLSHADRGVEPYGEFSARVASDDLTVARPYVEELHRQLGFAEVGPLCGPQSAYVTPFAQPVDAGQKAFGQAGREAKRQAEHESVRKAVQLELEEALGGLLPQDLSPEKSDALVRRVLFRGELPRSNAALRLECLESILDEHKFSLNRLACKRSYWAFKPAKPFFTEAAICAPGVLERVRLALDEKTSPIIGTQASVVELSYLFVMELALGSRVAITGALHAVLLQKTQTWQLVRFDNRYWFEWALRGEWTDGKPVFRVEISTHAASLASKLRKNERERDKFPRLPNSFAPVCQALGLETVDGTKFLKTLTHLRAQQNAFELPGFMASHLSGNRVASALPHRDWIRLLKDAAPVFPAGQDIPQDDDELESDERALPLAPTRDASATIDDQAGQTNDARAQCKKLFDQIDKTLSQSDDSAPGEATDGDTKKMSRRATVHAVDIEAAAERAATSSSFTRGDAPLELVRFVKHLAARPSKKGLKDRLRAATIERYWYALRDPFLEVIPDVNFEDLDEDEIVELFDALLEYWPAELRRKQASGKPSLEGKSAGDQMNRTLEQLPEFYEFLQARLDVPDIDWSAIGQKVPVTSRGKPGYVSEAEYLAALRLLAGDWAQGTPTDETLRACFVFVLCYRWGLRIGEPLGLRRCDVIRFEKTICVAVQGNYRRSLKNPPSRRIVPQLFELTDLETQVVDRTLHQWAVRGQKDLRTPIFPEVTKGSFKAIRSRVGRLIAANLRVFTRSNSTTHTLRHSFAMRVMQFVLGNSLQPGLALDQATCAHVRRTLLNGEPVDRRALWGGARALGHVSPSSTILSYLNCLDLWTPAPIASESSTKREFKVENEQVVNLDSLQLDADYLKTNLLSLHAHTQKDDAFSSFRDVFLGILDYLASSQHLLRGSAVADSIKFSSALGDMLGKAFARLAKRLPASKNRYGAWVLLGSVSIVRMAELRRLVDDRLDDACHPTHHSISWIENIGTSQQLLLYKREHFEVFSELARTFGITATDLHLVHPAVIDAELGNLTEEFNLKTFLTPLDRVPLGGLHFVKRFQFDTAVSADGRQSFRHRLAAVPAVGGSFTCRQELLLFWILWSLAGERFCRRAEG